MLFLLEIIEFLRDQKNKISDILKEDSGKEIYIFPIAYGITLWSQMLKASKAGDKLGFFSLLAGVLLIGSIAGLFLYFVYPYILTWVSKIFGKITNHKDMQKVFAWSLSPFIIGALLTILELLIGGKKIYSSVPVSTEATFITMVLGFILFTSYVISMYFLVVFTKSLSYALNIKWWKALLIIFISTAILMLPTFLI